MLSEHEKILLDLPKTWKTKSSYQCSCFSNLRAWNMPGKHLLSCSCYHHDLEEIISFLCFYWNWYLNLFSTMSSLTCWSGTWDFAAIAFIDEEILGVGTCWQVKLGQMIKCILEKTHIIALVGLTLRSKYYSHCSHPGNCRVLHPTLAMELEIMQNVWRCAVS